MARKKSKAQLESDFQAHLVKRIKNEILPGSWVLKNDSGYQQGIPDLSIFYGELFAMLEVKPERPTSPDDFEPNQEWFIEEFNKYAFAAVIFPENEEEVLHDLQQALGAGRSPRASQRK